MVGWRGSSRTEKAYARDAGSQGAQVRTLRCRGAWPLTRRAATPNSGSSSPVIAPATGTVIGHLTGRVIWDALRPWWESQSMRALSVIRRRLNRWIGLMQDVGTCSPGVSGLRCSGQ
jgi:hypothetical protein